MSLSKNDLLNSVGTTLDSSEFHTLLSNLSGNVKWDQIEGLGERYCLDKDSGISIIFDDHDVLTSIHLYLDNRDSYGHYDGWIGDGVNEHMGMGELIAVNGSPEKQGGGDKGFMGKISPPWVRYIFNGYSLHYEFSSDGAKIALVTIMGDEDVP